MITTYALNLLLKQSPEVVQDWLEQVWSGRISAGEDFFWHGLAEGASYKATRTSYVNSNEDKLGWATIAVKIYAYMASTLHALAPDSFENSAMMLRAFMIGKYGNIPGHPLLDVGEVERWFFQRLPMTLVEAQNKCPLPLSVYKNQIATVRELRAIKNRLNVIKALNEDGYLLDNRELQQWVQLQDKLP